MSDITSIIINDFNLSPSLSVEEKELLEILTVRVTEMLEGDIDLLLSYLYRLDISESKINGALQMNNVLPANRAIAQLILDRQKQRVATKKAIQVDPIAGWEY